MRNMRHIAPVQAIGGGDGAGGLYSCKSRGIRSTRNTRNTDPFKPRTDESLALCHPYLQWGFSVHPHHLACAQQNGDRCRSVGIIVHFVLEKAFACCATVVMLCAW